MNLKKEADFKQHLEKAGFWLAYELQLGGQKVGGFSQVFVHRSATLEVPSLLKPTVGGAVQYVSSTEIFLSSSCVRGAAFGHPCAGSAGG